MGEAPSLDHVIAELDDRARAESRLEQYRIEASPGWLDAVPNGWFASEALERLCDEGGWWPGEWDPTFSTDEAGTEVLHLLQGHEGLLPGAEPEVRWMHLGSVWEKDHFFTPLLREQMPTAPLFGSSAQALWEMMVFPTEAALLESFLITYDTVGIKSTVSPMAGDGVDPFFVEWITRPPLGPGDEHRPAELLAHERLVGASSRWVTSHRCWSDEDMPQMVETGNWPQHVVAQLLAVEPHFVRTHCAPTARLQSAALRAATTSQQRCATPGVDRPAGHARTIRRARRRTR